MSNLAVGIIGLPNVGKSTLFNALLKRSLANVAEHPFTTIEPNTGVVEVPDERLKKLAEIVKKEKGNKDVKIVPASVKFVDIAGLVKGAHKGEGLGNKFLAKIREVDAIVHVLRGFEDERVPRVGGQDAKEDYEIVATELCLADLEAVEKKLEDKELKKLKDGAKRIELLKRIKDDLAKGVKVTSMNLTEDEMEVVKDLFLLTAKPELVVFNVGEKDSTKKLDDAAMTICGRLEVELGEFSPVERKEYLKTSGIKKEALDLLIEKAFEILKLIRFYTLKGGKEITAWSISRGTTALGAAKIIHEDFARGFIKAEGISFEEMAKIGGWQYAQKLGKTRLEGKDYQIADGEVVEFKFKA
jgi:hypothetical protein